MASAGASIHNPLDGERLTFLATAGDTGGELLRIKWSAPAGWVLPGAHLHPFQEERFHVQSGIALFRLAGEERRAGPGDVVSVPAGTPHFFRNAGDGELAITIEFRPALRTEGFFETIWGLARDGKTNAAGMPRPLQAALIAQEFDSEVRIGPQRALPLSLIPRPLQRAIFAALAPIARRRGYRAVYPEYTTRSP